MEEKELCKKVTDRFAELIQGLSLEELARLDIEYLFVRIRNDALPRALGEGEKKPKSRSVG